MARVLVRFLMCGCIAWWGVAATVARAQQMSLIRDSEIEHTIRLWADPLFAAAGLDPAAIHIFLVNDRTLNAFVAGGQNLFLHTGLLMSSDGPDQVIGVMAHETGHIAGGHLARGEEGMRAAQNVTLLHTLLGLGLVAAGALAGSNQTAGAASAVIAGGQAAGLRTYLAYSQIQERSADQAGLNLLDRTGHSARGLLNFLKKLENQELLVAGRQDPYLRTHPLTQDRIAHIAEHVQSSRWSDVPPKPDDVERHARMIAKLAGFLEPPERVLQRYPPEDQSLPGRYARAIAYYLIPDLEAALGEVDSLIKERPRDPYFHELKGQILFENGRVDDAVPCYQAANRLRPGDPLLLTELAQAQIETGDPDLARAAIDSLKRAVRLDRTNSTSWRLLSIGYGRDGRVDESSLAAGEQALLEGRHKDALLHAARAERLFPEGSPGWLQAEDIRELAERRQDEAHDHQ